MKSLRIVVLLMFCVGLLFASSSCVVLIKESPPRHQGWYRNSNNPHHPFSTNPGKSKGNHSEKKHHQD